MFTNRMSERLLTDMEAERRSIAITMPDQALRFNRQVQSATVRNWKPYSVLALSGSLRKASLNTAMLAMANNSAPPGLCVTVCSCLGELPLFNPDFAEREPFAVAQLRQQVAAADALLIASPEYAHGVSSVMKNALDWLVASGVFVDKPVVLWNAAPRAWHALAALRETLNVMSAQLIDAAELELLIQRDASEQTPPNPDPMAMRRSLRALKTALDGVRRKKHDIFRNLRSGAASASDHLSSLEG